MMHIKWLCMFVVVLESRNAFCIPSLHMEVTVTGVRSYSVVIPCTYMPSTEHEEVKVEWLLGTDMVISRFESQDNIPLIKFRGRVSVSKSPPGDVSLKIRKLNFGDKGNLKCKVTWKKSSGNVETKEDITELKILRVKPTTDKPDVIIVTTKQPEVTTMKPVTDQTDVRIVTIKGTMKPVTNKPNVRIVTTKEPEILTIKPVTNKPNVRIATTKEPEILTKILTTKKTDLGVTTAAETTIITVIHTTKKTDLAVTTVAETTIITGTSHVDDVSNASKFNTIESSRTIKQTEKFHTSTNVMSTYTTAMIHNNPVFGAITGSGIPFYVLIISLICVLCIVILIIVLIIRKKKQNVNAWNIPVRNQQVLDLGAPGGECHSCNNQTVASNDYQLWNPQPVSIYEGVVPDCSNEYEALIAQNPQENITTF
ncbi:V-set and immunoglobulin domain-containing protein 4 isoform X2 [Mixophyes fleayi]|uniref:V-set and immunoglobulin domain-containing protein 4 isoform X2 n=1 Tax=Mixophyes fleayi TaxID=3061075 RepID=UPI003F4D9791